MTAISTKMALFFITRLLDRFIAAKPTEQRRAEGLTATPMNDQQSHALASESH